MKHFEVSIAVGPIDADVVEQLKAAGLQVFRGKRTWRVDATSPVYGQDSVRAQAHVLVATIISDFSLDPLGETPNYTIRDPDGPMDERPDLLLEDLRRADQPDPMPQPPPKWYQNTKNPNGDRSQQ